MPLGPASGVLAYTTQSCRRRACARSRRARVVSAGSRGNNLAAMASVQRLMNWPHARQERGGCGAASTRRPTFHWAARRTRWRSPTGHSAVFDNAVEFCMRLTSGIPPEHLDPAATGLLAVQPFSTRDHCAKYTDFVKEATAAS